MAKVSFEPFEKETDLETETGLVIPSGPIIKEEAAEAEDVTMANVGTSEAAQDTIDRAGARENEQSPSL